MMTNTIIYTKETIALALYCWILADEECHWATKMYANPKGDLHGFNVRFTLNADGFDTGRDAEGTLMANFSFDGRSIMSPAPVDDFDAKVRLREKVLDGIIECIPEFRSLTETLAFEIEDQLRAFDSMIGVNVVEGWSSSNQVWNSVIQPNMASYRIRSNGAYYIN